MDVYARIAARRGELDRLAAYFEWAGSKPVAGSGNGAAHARGYRAICRLTAAHLRAMPATRGDRSVVAWLERWERIAQRRMDAAGFDPCDRKPVPSLLWFADGIAWAARDAVAIVRSKSAVISDWGRLHEDRELSPGWHDIAA